jgi:hypothetical protein
MNNGAQAKYSEESEPFHTGDQYNKLAITKGINTFTNRRTVLLLARKNPAVNIAEAQKTTMLGLILFPFLYPYYRKPVWIVF